MVAAVVARRSRVSTPLPMPADVLKSSALGGLAPALMMQDDHATTYLPTYFLIAAPKISKRVPCAGLVQQNLNSFTRSTIQGCTAQKQMIRPADSMPACVQRKECRCSSD